MSVHEQDEERLPPEEMDQDEDEPDRTEDPSMAQDDILEDMNPEVDDVDTGDLEADIEKLENLVKKHQETATLASDNGNPELLSTTVLRLARVNSALGRKAAYASYIARNADRAARRYRGGKVLEYAEKMAVNKAEPKAEQDSKKQFRIASDAQLIADQASDLCYRTDTFLKMAQSRLSLIKGDLKNA